MKSLNIVALKPGIKLGVVSPGNCNAHQNWKSTIFGRLEIISLSDFICAFKLLILGLFIGVHTDVANENGPFAHLWSKMVIFKRVFHNHRVLPHLCPSQKFWPLMRAFNWGTIKGFSSRGIRMARGQSFRLLTLLNKNWVFQKF